MPTNDILPFCPTDTGTNLLSEADYLAAADRTIGNQPGVASAKLVNKALRQASYLVSQFAQYISDRTATDVLDDATPAKLLAQTNAAFRYLNPIVTSYLSAAGNHNLTYKFMIAQTTIAPTAGATYTNNGVTYTCTLTVTGLQFNASGNGAPLANGTLTKTGGTGDATLLFYAVRAPLYLKLRMVGGGGGGGGSGTSGAGNGGDGGTTTFGTAFLTATGGIKGVSANGSIGGSGGTGTIGAGAVGITIPGSIGGANAASFATSSATGGRGGDTAFGGGGGNGYQGSSGQPGATNSGGGGGGGGMANTAGAATGTGGGGGAYIDVIITSPLSTYAYAVGAAGTAGAIGVGGSPGGLGAAGCIIIEEHYQ